MSVTLHDLAERFDLRWWWESPTEGRRVELPDPETARAMLARLAGHHGQLQPLRRLAWEGAPEARPPEDEDLFEQLAHCVSRGTIVITALARPTLGAVFAAPEEEEPAPPIPRAASASAPEAAAAPVEPPTFPADVDVIAITRARREAARLGLPFCEECMKKGLEDERRAAKQGAVVS